MRTTIKHALCQLSNFHRQGSRKDIFVFATPRGGSTWFAEIVASQPRVKIIDEPFNFRRDNVARLGLFDNWADLVCGGARDDDIIDYLNELRQGRHGYMNPVPFRRNHRFFTDRIVFKIHEAEHLIPRIEKECNGEIVLLLRHPIATTISRRVFPRVEHYLASSTFLEQHLNAEERSYAARVVATGEPFEVGILSWVLENIIPLRSFEGRRWLDVTYEELLLAPEEMARLLAERLDLEDYPALLSSMFRESTNITMSSATTQEILEDPDRARRNRRLVTKWSGQISQTQRAQCAEILEFFRIDAYSADTYLPSAKHVHFLDTASVESVLQSEAPLTAV